VLGDLRAIGFDGRADELACIVMGVIRVVAGDFVNGFHRRVALADVGAHLVTDRDCLGDVVGRDSDPEVSKRHHEEVVGVRPWGERCRWVGGC
jgi:hypothetical protein